ncbi:ATP-binding protein [Jiulongibacter sediminis]|jgi:hypothetical protein|uniref:ATP-binding protein n=1 Tax=Jiulongibacter sediminis TaxID=1605367 RepID=UPI0026EED708|nr:ATP-binding protein [Jiulongibacter sediminis]
MSKSLYLLVFTSFIFNSCVTNSESEDEKSAESQISTSATPSLQMAWQTDTTLATPESVIYDASNDVFYVSCIAGMPPGAHDGDGYIAKVGPSGEILANPWVTGLDAPKGMAIYDGKLYVTDIDKLVSIDLNSGEVLSKTLVLGAQFLNDADVDGDGTIYMTDTETATLFMAKGDEITEVFKNDELGRLNGVFIDGDRKLFTSGKVFTLEGEDLQMVADSIGGGDGVEKYKDGYFVSNWSGEIYHLASDWTKTKVLDTKDAGINAADIDIIESKNLLIVPTFFENRITAYTIK